jgi:hypothetical protein
MSPVSLSLYEREDIVGALLVAEDAADMIPVIDKFYKRIPR